MARTLKEQYEAKQVKRLQERLRPIDRKVISELRWSPQDMLILEAFNQTQMKSAIDTVKKLKGIDFGALGSLAAGRDAALKDVTNALAGGSKQGLVRKIVNLFKSDKENPLVDALAFCSALDNFFGQFSQYVTALGGDKQDQPLSTILTGKTPDEIDDLNAIQGLGGDEKKNLKNMQNVIIKGFKPDGALARISKTWVDKYMGGRKGLQALAKDLLKMTPKDLNAISHSVSESMKNVSAAGDAASGASQQGTTGTNGADGTEAAQSTKPEQGTKGTKSGDTGPGAQVPTSGTKANVDTAKVLARIKPAMEDMGVRDVDALVARLEDLGVLRNP